MIAAGPSAAGRASAAERPGDRGVRVGGTQLLFAAATCLGIAAAMLVVARRLTGVATHGSTAAMQWVATAAILAPGALAAGLTWRASAVAGAAPSFSYSALMAGPNRDRVLSPQAPRPTSASSSASPCWATCFCLRWRRWRASLRSCPWSSPRFSSAEAAIAGTSPQR